MRIDCRPKNIHPPFYSHPCPSIPFHSLSQDTKDNPIRLASMRVCVSSSGIKIGLEPNKNQHKMCQHLYVATPQGRAPKNVSLCAKAFLLLRFWPPPRGWLLGTTCFPMAQDAYLCQRSGWKGKSIFMGRKHTATETSTHLHTHKQIMSHRSPVERTEEKLKVCRGLAF